MQRIALIMALFVLLVNGPHGGTTPPEPVGDIVVQARRLPDAEAGDPARFGPLRLLDAWQLTSPQPVFGGISSLTADDDGALVALNDRGELFGFPVLPDGLGGVMPLPRARGTGLSEMALGFGEHGA